MEGGNWRISSTSRPGMRLRQVADGISGDIHEQVVVKPAAGCGGGLFHTSIRRRPIGCATIFRAWPASVTLTRSCSLSPQDRGPAYLTRYRLAIGSPSGSVPYCPTLGLGPSPNREGRGRARSRCVLRHFPPDLARAQHRVHAPQQVMGRRHQGGLPAVLPPSADPLVERPHRRTAADRLPRRFHQILPRRGRTLTRWETGTVNIFCRQVGFSG